MDVVIMKKCRICDDGIEERRPITWEKGVHFHRKCYYGKDHVCAYCNRKLRVQDMVGIEDVFVHKRCLEDYKLLLAFSDELEREKAQWQRLYKTNPEQCPICGKELGIREYRIVEKVIFEEPVKFHISCIAYYNGQQCGLCGSDIKVGDEVKMYRGRLSHIDCIIRNIFYMNCDMDNEERPEK